VAGLSSEADLNFLSWHHTALEIGSKCSFTHM
jgi:hypothetical protein